MIPSEFPFTMRDVYKEVYWVDQFIGDDPMPPVYPGTTFRHEEVLTEPFPFVDIYGYVSQQMLYRRNYASHNSLVKDSNLGLLRMVKSGFKGYEHRVPIRMIQAVHGYTTWNDVKQFVTDSMLRLNSVLAFRNRPAPSAGRDLYGNAFFGSSVFHDWLIGDSPVHGIKWAWLGQYDKSNIPCGRGLFIYRDMVNGVGSSSYEFCDPISAVFHRYYYDISGNITYTPVTLYYHPSDNKWKNGINGVNASNYYAHPDIIPRGESDDLQQNYIREIVDGDVTENKMYVPVQRDIYLLKDFEDNWAVGTKMQRYGVDLPFQGEKYRINGELINGDYLEAILINSEYRHETLTNFVSWGYDYRFWTFVNGEKTGEPLVGRNIPYIT
jgi:hypothetical protein